MGSAFADYLGHPVVVRAFSAEAVLQAMLDMEAALLVAQAELGLMPAESATAASACCRLDGWVADDLVASAAVAGSLAIPLVQALRARVQATCPEALPWVHRGLTSQDLIDTAWALQSRRALAVVQHDLRRLLAALRDLQQQAGSAPMLARTLMQAASVVTFEVRLLNWAQPLARCLERLTEQADRALRLQMAGPVGTARGWGEAGQALTGRVAHHMSLPVADFPWQVQRDEPARLAAELGVLAGCLGKLATDVAFMAQPEVRELQEAAAPGRGGSSSMPHKRNPVGAMVALAALHRAPARVAALLGAMAHEQERALGPWQAEAAEWAELWGLCAAATTALADALTGAQADPMRMRANIEQAGAAGLLDAGFPNKELGWNP